MSRRARFDGPHDDVFVFDPQAPADAAPIDHVVRGGLLSTDVPARIRDELLARDNWSEVKQAESKTEEKD